MTQSKNPPPIIGLFGGLFGLMFVRLSGSLLNIQLATIIGLGVCIIGAIWGAILFSEHIYFAVLSWYQERPWYKQIDSQVYSLYFKYRARVLERLGVLN